MAKLPAFQFYPGDWMKDPAVRSCSYAARGLWIDMLCLMHESDRRGFLQMNGKPVTAEMLARITGGSTDEVSRLLQELENSGVFSCTSHGMIFSRRMVRDERKRRKCAIAGRKGGGNPDLRKESTFKGGSKGGPKGRSKGERGSSSSSSSSTSVLPPKSPKGDEGVALPPALDTPAFRRAWDDWLQHHRELRKRYTPTGLRRLVNRLLVMGEARAIAAIEFSLSNNYQGIVEPGRPPAGEEGPRLLPAEEWVKQPYSPG